MTYNNWKFTKGEVIDADPYNGKLKMGGKPLEEQIKDRERAMKNQTRRKIKKINEGEIK